MKVILNDRELALFLSEIGNQESTLYLVKYVIESRLVLYFGGSDDLKRQLTDQLWKMIHCFDERPLSAQMPPERDDVAKILVAMFDLIESGPLIALEPSRGTPEVDQVITDAFAALRAKTGLKFDLRWRGDGTGR